MHEDMLIHHLPSIKGVLLDCYLESGWYRYGSGVFTTSAYISNETSAHPVWWLRYRVDAVQIDRKAKAILNKATEMSVVARPFSLTAELEQLHDQYYSSINFPTNESIADLMEDVYNCVFDSQLIEIRDGKTLIAAGIYDQGTNSIAGIKNIFDPRYAKWSLGKRLMIEKWRYCLSNQIEWYYPGYIIPGISAFDYKLFLDKEATEVLCPDTQQWLPFSFFVERHKNALQFIKRAD